MFFENDSVGFSILSVIEIKRKNRVIDSAGRNFSALSFRIHSNSIFKDSTGEHRLEDNYITFVPAEYSYTRITEYEDMIAIHFNLQECHTDGIEFFKPDNPEILEKLFKNILECWQKKETGYKYKCAAIFNEILSICYKQNFKPRAETSKIQNSVEYINKNYKDPDISISKIAEESFMSEVYFRKLFKKEYGISPQKYIIELRIQHAANLILTGYYSLKEVALMSGYTDYKYFSTEFKKQKGVSPSDYFYKYPTKAEAGIDTIL